MPGCAKRAAGVCHRATERVVTLAGIPVAMSAPAGIAQNGAASGASSGR
jgi:hypothetical protein